MKKLATVVAGFAALAFIAAPAMPAMAYEAGDVKDGAITVSSAEDLEQALSDTTVKNITLGADIELSGKLSVERDVTIDGAGKKVAFDGNKEWVSNFIQVYKADVTVKNITVEEGNLGFFVNGGELTLDGTVNVSGNFGGIGLSQGKNVSEVPTLNINGVFNYTGETTKTPAIYKDENTKEFTVKSDLIKAGAKVQDGTEKIYFYFNEESMPTADDKNFVAMTDEEINAYRSTPIKDETPEVTPPVEDETKGETEAEVEAPNTGATVTNAALVVTSIAAAVVAAAYAVRFAGARK